MMETEQSRITWTNKLQFHHSSWRHETLVEYSTAFTGGPSLPRDQPPPYSTWPSSSGRRRILGKAQDWSPRNKSNYAMDMADRYRIAAHLELTAVSHARANMKPCSRLSS